MIIVGSGAIGTEFAYFYNSLGTKVDTSGTGIKASVKTQNSEEVLEADMLLSAVGISPNTENIGLEELGIKTDKGRIIVDGYQQTNVPGVYAIGDCTPHQALAHKASKEGVNAAEHICGEKVEPIDYNNVPGCTYCTPEIASVGFTEKAAKEAGYGDNVTELIAEVVVARKLETTAHEILNAIHPHPTMSEAVKEATAIAYGESTDT